MTEFIAFEATVEPMEWGRATYTILRLPPAVSETLAEQRARRVEGEINDHPINLALVKAPVVEGVFLWAGQSLLDAVGVVPGEPLEIRLRKAPDDRVETPDDVHGALSRSGRLTAWETLSPGKRRSLLYQVNTAKRAETRAKRIAKLVSELS